MHQLLENPLFNLLKIKIWGDFNKYRIYYLKENMLNQTFDINLKNCFLTHGFFCFIIYLCLNF